MIAAAAHPMISIKIFKTALPSPRLFCTDWSYGSPFAAATERPKDAGV
jgi:hypothetical protein